MIDTADTTLSAFFHTVLPFRHKLGGAAKSSSELGAVLAELAQDPEAKAPFEALLSPSAGPGTFARKSLAHRLRALDIFVDEDWQGPEVADDEGPMNEILRVAATRFLKVPVGFGGLMILLAHPAVVRVEPRPVYRRSTEPRGDRS